MNQALRLLENEHQELQAKIECLQGDRDLCSSDTQHLQGTLLLRHLWPSETSRRSRMEKRASLSLPFVVWLALRFHHTLRERQGCVHHPWLKTDFVALAHLGVPALFQPVPLGQTTAAPRQSHVSRPHSWFERERSVERFLSSQPREDQTVGKYNTWFIPFVNANDLQGALVLVCLFRSGTSRRKSNSHLTHYQRPQTRQLPIRNFPPRVPSTLILGSSILVCIISFFRSTKEVGGGETRPGDQSTAVAE